MSIYAPPKHVHILCHIIAPCATGGWACKLRYEQLWEAGSIFRNEPYPTKKIRMCEIECIEIQMDAHVMLGQGVGWCPTESCTTEHFHSPSEQSVLLFFCSKRFVQ